MKIRILLLIAAFCGGVAQLVAQDIPVSPSITGTGVFLGETKPLRDLPVVTPQEMQLHKERAEKKQFNKKLNVRDYPFADVALPKGPDAVWQKTMGKSMASNTNPIVNVDGQTSPYFPPDCNGTAGPNHFMQTVNCTYAIYNKSGVKVAGPTNMNLLFNGVSGSNYNDGDPIVLYDEQADRWFATEFTIGHTNDVMMVAVSTTNDPTGTWYAYSFDIDNNPDYPKFSVWQDGYYMGVNKSSGKDTYVFERSQILAGAASPKFVGFDNPNRPSSIDNFMCVPPVDNDGPFAPAGSPGLYIAMHDDAFGGGNDELWIYELVVNWANTTASTFSRVQQLQVPPFDSNFGNNWTNIKQPGTSQELDAIPQVIMNVPQYRNFGSYQTLMCCHTVDVDNTDHAGVRWYELRKTTGNWTVRQSGTYAPDAHSRWMGSIMMNGNHEIGLGYSISSTTVYPGIRFCGQTSAENANALGVMDFAEDTIHLGTASQTGYERWGDYAQLCVDPSDDATFWFTTEYIQGGGRKTKIASFQVGPIFPTADFTASNTLPCLSSTTVAFISQSTNNPTEYLWHFTPNLVTYTDGTDSTSINPKVIFNAYGTYTVALKVTNGGGSNTTTKTDYIHVNEANADFAANATTVVIDNYTTFSDASTCGATSWLWDFGTDASPATATTQGPHTVSYSTTGPKTIKLTVNGISTETKTDYVNVIGYNVNMTTATVSMCSGSFFDAGGPSANYGDNQNNTLLFRPGIPGSKLQFVFTSFNIEAQTTCNKDYLKIFDGTTVFAPLIGTYCGTNSPGTITASNDEGAVLFVFHSNASINMEGWSASVACTAIPTGNPASIAATPVSSSQIDINWSKNTDNNDVLLAWSPDGVFGTPVNGTSYTVGTVIPGGGTVLAKGSATVFNHTGLASSTKYYYKAFSFNAETRYSSGIDVNATTLFQPTLSVEPLNINVTSPSGNAPFNIYSNTAWTTSSDQSWCTLAASGTGNTSVLAIYEENFSVNARIAHITITVTGLPAQQITLTQAGAAPLLAVTPPNQNVADPLGNTAFTVTSNTDWIVSSDQPWCTVNLSGSHNGTITAGYQQNLTVFARVAHISVTVNGLSSVIVTVTQAGAAPLLAVTPPNQNVTDPSGVTPFTVTSNADWIVSSDKTWCVVNQAGTGAGTISATYAQNLSLQPRVAHISVTVNGLSSVIVTVTQAGAAPMVAVTPNVINVNAYNGSVDFAVTSNTDWTASADSAWCVVTASGSGNGVITAVYPWNPNKKNRTAKISVHAAGVSTQVVTLIQGQETASVPEDGAKGLSIYPNPAKGLFNIVVDKSKYPSMQVTISDATGAVVTNRQCKGESEYHFDLSKSPQGTYFVKIKTDTEMLVTKLIIIK
ncbi:MAG: BACON domain-containing carbohydrate-binding protein [Bacteroidota bacterium]